MNQYELLWEYQQADVAAENMKKNISKSPKRLKLVKLRDSIQERQALIEALGNEITAMVDRLDVLQDAIGRIEDRLKQTQQKIQGSPASNAETAKGYILEIQALLNDTISYDDEVKRIKRDSVERANKQRSMKKEALAIKAEFDLLREEYNAEYQEQSKELEKLQAIAEEKSKGLSEEIKAMYLEKKQRCNPPIAKLVDDRCGGCNMSFPSSTLHAIKQGNNTECENCGRLIIV